MVQILSEELVEYEEDASDIQSVSCLHQVRGRYILTDNKSKFGAAAPLPVHRNGPYSLLSRGA